jgi:hypothetical protein
MNRIKKGDLVALPLKSAPAVAFGRVTGGYRFDPDAPDEVRHERQVQWIREDVPRSEIDQELLYSLGAFMHDGLSDQARADRSSSAPAHRPAVAARWLWQDLAGRGEVRRR